MPRKNSGNFDIDGKFNQTKYMKEWSKQNMKMVRGSYSAAFVDEFKEACNVLGVSQSSVIREAMEETIKKARGL